MIKYPSVAHQSFNIIAKFADNCCLSSVKVHYVYAPCCQTEVAQVSKHTAPKVPALSRCLCVSRAVQTFSNTRAIVTRAGWNRVLTIARIFPAKLKLTGTGTN